MVVQSHQELLPLQFCGNGSTTIGGLETCTLLNCQKRIRTPYAVCSSRSQPQIHRKENTMSEPIVFISHFKVKEGKLEGLKAHAQMMIELIKAEKPGTLAFIQYLNGDETELSIVHVFPDANAFDRHGEGVAERARAGFEFIEPISRELYGM